jgi:hypothetical protein
MVRVGWESAGADVTGATVWIPINDGAADGRECASFRWERAECQTLDGW